MRNAPTLPLSASQVPLLSSYLGGKDALIVDGGADLDTAVTAAVQGAFGFNGQKCSAMSRLIVLDSVYDEVMNAFVERASRLKVGQQRRMQT